jgi:hypothetical protein
MLFAKFRCGLARRRVRRRKVDEILSGIIDVGIIDRVVLDDGLGAAEIWLKFRSGMGGTVRLVLRADWPPHLVGFYGGNEPGAWRNRPPRWLRDQLVASMDSGVAERWGIDKAETRD